jgi:hypothetical protein
VKIYSNTLTSADLSAAIQAANQHTPSQDGDPFHGTIGFERYRELTRPRVRARGWDVLLYRTGSTMHFNSGRYGAGEQGAASWDDYGWFLAELFRRDPALHAAYYRDETDFHRATRNGFKPEDQGGSPRLTSSPAKRRLTRLGFSKTEASQILATARRHYTPGYHIRPESGGRYVVTYGNKRYQITREDGVAGQAGTELSPERITAAVADMERVQRNLEAGRTRPDPIVFG